MAVRGEGSDFDLILVGRKGRDYFRFRNYPIGVSYEGVTDSPTYENARNVAAVVKDRFVNEEVDRVFLVYMAFRSIGSQSVEVRRFLPLSTVSEIAALGEGAGVAKEAFEFEPSPDGVLEALLPRYVESRLFSALLDASASEHANRQRAMKAATDNAEELITKLTRMMNRARQDAITTEIMEIVGGAEALRSASAA